MIKDTDIMPQSAFDDMEREIRLMKRLSHENIVKIRGYISNIGTHTIIVMEYIREGSLDRLVQNYFKHIGTHATENLPLSLL